MEHLFDVDIAEKYGVNAAIVLRHLQFWIIKNKAHNKHLFDGRTWTYFSVRAFTEIFPYWTTRQLRVILDKLIEMKVLTKGNYNPKGYDHTSWYAFTNEKRFVRIDKSNCQNGQMDLSKRANGFAGNDKPLPNPITNGLTDESTKSKGLGLISSEKKLELDLQIKKDLNFFIEQVIGTEQVPGIFQFFTARETQTFKRIVAYLVEQCQVGKLPGSIFRDAVEWARTAKSSTAANKKGLFVAKIKQETGFNKQKKLLDKIGEY